jgi:hypothetical protein
MNISLGEDTTTTPAVTTDTTGTASSCASITAAAAKAATFSSGLNLWTSPGCAFSALTTLIASPSDAFSGPVLPFTMGVLLPPLALIGIGIAMMAGGRRR